MPRYAAADDDVHTGRGTATAATGADDPMRRRDIFRRMADRVHPPETIEGWYSRHRVPAADRGAPRDPRRALAAAGALGMP